MLYRIPANDLIRADNATKTAHVIVLQRTMRLGQAMDANTMRWFGAFLFATQICVSPSGHDTITGGGFNVKRCKLTHRNRSKRKKSYDLTKLEDHPHQTRAVVEQLLSLEGSFPATSMGGGDTQNERKRKISGTTDRVTNDVRTTLSSH